MLFQFGRQIVSVAVICTLLTFPASVLADGFSLKYLGRFSVPKNQAFSRVSLIAHRQDSEFVVWGMHGHYQRLEIKDNGDIRALGEFQQSDLPNLRMTKYISALGVKPRIKLLGMAFRGQSFLRNYGQWYNVHPHLLPTVAIDDQGPILFTAGMKQTEQWSGAIPEKWRAALGADMFAGGHVTQGGGRSYGPSFSTWTFPTKPVVFFQELQSKTLMHIPETDEFVLPARTLPDGRWNNASKINGAVFVGDHVVYPTTFAAGNYTYGNAADHIQQAKSLGLPEPNLNGLQHRGMYGQTDKGFEPVLLIVEASDLAVVRRGSLSPENVPYRKYSLDKELLDEKGLVNAAFNPSNNLLVVLEIDADRELNKYEPGPFIHLYRFNSLDPSAPMDTE